MSDNSAIEWTDSTYNPIRARNLTTGKIGHHCEHVSEGCRFCYAEGFNHRLGTGLAYKPGHRSDIEIFLDEKTLLQPLRWKRPRMIFVGSMTDLFADFVTDETLDKIFAVMALTPQHTYQVLTKRPERMREYLKRLSFEACGTDAGWAPRRLDQHACALSGSPCAAGFMEDVAWPLKNVWLGTSCEDQSTADERIPPLLQTPAAVRFISAEPLLGPIDLSRLPFVDGDPRHSRDALSGESYLFGQQTNGGPDITVKVTKPLLAKLDWVICGGESGPKARPMHADWARSLRDQCAGRVPFFFKQWGRYLPVGQSLPGFGKILGASAVKLGRLKLHYRGGPKQVPKHAFAARGVGFASTTDGLLTFCVGKKAGGRLLDGVEHNGMPQAQS